MNFYCSCGFGYDFDGDYLINSGCYMLHNDLAGEVFLKLGFYE